MKTFTTLLLTTALSGTGFAQALQVAPNGNVGIGTSAPGSKLSVWGGVAEINTANLAGEEVLDWPLAALTIRRFDNFTQMKMLQFGHIQDNAYQVHDSVWAFSLADDVASKLTSDTNTKLLLQGPGHAVFFPRGRFGIGSFDPQAKFEVHTTESFPSNVGSVLPFANFTGLTGNYDQVQLKAKRFVNGTGWDSAAIYLQRRVDVSDMGFVKFEQWDVALGSGEAEHLRVMQGGNVGIGTKNPSHKLTVNGQVKSRGFVTDTSNWADHVFADDYKLASLDEVEAHIKEKRHLPGVPSEAEVVSKGLDLGQMSAVQMAKIEELMLHMIALNKKVEAQAEEIRQLKAGRKEQF
jgi:hypothetical protein